MFKFICYIHLPVVLFRLSAGMVYGIIGKKGWLMSESFGYFYLEIKH